MRLYNVREIIICLLFKERGILKKSAKKRKLEQIVI